MVGLACSASARGQQTPASWLTGTSGNWSNAARWQGGVVPNNQPGGPTYAVTINTGAGPAYIVTLDVPTELDSLALASPATLDVRNVLRLNGPLTTTLGNVRVSGGSIIGGSISGTGSLVADTQLGSSNLTDVTINGGLSLSSTGAVPLANALFLNGTTSISGNLDIGGSGRRVVLTSPISIGGTTTVGALAVLELQANQSLASGRTLVMQGGPGFESRVIAPLGNSLTIAPGATLRGSGQFSAGLNNAGQVLAQNGTLTIDGPFTNTGTFSSASLATLNIGGSSTVPWTNAGTINVGGGTVQLGGVFTTASIGTLTGNGNVEITGTLDNRNSTIGFQPTGPLWRLTSGTILGGTINLASASSLLFGQGDLGPTATTLDGVTVNGDMFNQSQMVRIRHGFAINGTATINGSSILNNASLVIDGTQSFTAGTLRLSSNVLIEGSSVFTSETGTTLDLRGATLGAQSVPFGFNSLVNRGAITSTLGPNFIRTAFFTNYGTITNAVGVALTIGAGTWTNTGSITSSGGTLTLDGVWSNNGSIVAINTDVTLAGTFTTGQLGSFTRLGGTLRQTGRMNNAGRTFTTNNSTGYWRLDGGSIDGGTLATADGYRLLFSGNQSNAIRNATVTGDFTVGDQNVTDASFLRAVNVVFATQVRLNQGATLALGSNVQFDSPLQLVGTGSATLLADPGATVVFGSNSGFTNFTPQLRGLGTFVNRAFVTANANATFDAGSAAFVNEGTIRLLSGGRLIASGDMDTPHSFRNTGTIQLTPGGILNLGGRFSPSDLGTITRTGGTLTVNGIVDNQGQTLDLGRAPGGWTLSGGTINGGAVLIPGGSSLQLIAPEAGSFGQTRLNGVTFTGNLFTTGTSYWTGTNSVAGTLTANSARLWCDPGTVLSSGEFNSAATGSTNSSLEIFQRGATLTIGPGASFTGGWYFGSGGTIINQGVISANASTFMRFNTGTYTNVGTIEATAFGTVDMSNAGVLTNYQSGRLVGGTWRAAANGVLNLGDSRPITANAANISVSGPSASIPALAFLQSNEGTLLLDGGKDQAVAALANSGVIGLGAGCDLTTPSFTQISAGSLIITLGGTTPGSQFGRLTSPGPLTLAGSLVINLSNFVPTVGTDIVILSGSSISGAFESLTLPSLPPDRFMTISYGGGAVHARVIALVPSPATATLFAACIPLCRRKRRA